MGVEGVGCVGVFVCVCVEVGWGGVRDGKRGQRRSRNSLSSTFALYRYFIITFIILKNIKKYGSNALTALRCTQEDR